MGENDIAPYRFAKVLCYDSYPFLNCILRGNHIWKSRDSAWDPKSKCEKTKINTHIMFVGE